MSVPILRKLKMRRLAVAAAVAGAMLLSASLALAQPVFPRNISLSGNPAMSEGWGDRNNSIAWSMIWWPCSPGGCLPWENKLYVGTGRNLFCVQEASLKLFYPKTPYPPLEPAADCPPDPTDLKLQAEIWRWTPETDTWDRVYQAPNDVAIQGTDPVKFTSRDIGYRGITIFKEADGTEALYVAGVTSRARQDGTGLAGWVPAPRILRSTDGVIFKELPHDPGTFMNENLLAGFRTLLTYKGKLYTVGSVGQEGQGIILEATHPEAGNDAFQQVSPEKMTVFEIETYNGFLWAGTGTQTLGHAVPHPFELKKTDATGTPPYALDDTVIAGVDHRPSPAVISMHVFNGRLFVGSDREVFRVNPDDTWDLVVGQPYTTPGGRKLEPLSGFDLGFDSWFFNIHMWRMGSHDGTLYVGTHDQTTKWRIFGLGPLVKDRMGADLYASTDGWHFSMITRTGFGDKFNNGWRNFASTPSGLFIGAANLKGTWIYRGERVPSPVATPERLEVESGLKAAGLSWAGSPTAVRFHVYRDSGFTNPREIGVTDATTPAGRVFLDKKIVPFKVYHYSVVAEDKDGNLSDPSNMVRIPFKGPVPTFKSLRALLNGWKAPAAFNEHLSIAQAEVAVGNYTKALVELGIMRTAKTLLRWRGDDLDVLLAKFIRRVNLAQAGALSPIKLML